MDKTMQHSIGTTHDDASENTDIPNSFPTGIAFAYRWRNYQQRILDELNPKLTDKHLHIVAPPGSGKTVLGLEVMLRLNKPTLILAPTLAIRDQWAQRFCELFLRTTQEPDWISKDIREPRLITIVTYQGLHAACNRQPDMQEKLLNAIAKKLKKKNTGTLILDEAHHLKNEWWKTLYSLKNKLAPTTVALTATPPYDSTALEWQRYIDMNGAIDMEISVPELVFEKDLCPHQDYLYLTFPNRNEYEQLNRYRTNIENLFEEIKNDETLAEAIEKHPVWNAPLQHTEWIYDNLSYYSAMLIFLHHNQKEIPPVHLEIIGDKDIQIPSMDYDWMEILLNFYLYAETVHFVDYESHREKLENRLRHYGAIEKKEISFLYNRRINRLLTASISKLEAIKEIVGFEYRQLGKELRMVILTDYIRKEFFESADADNLQLTKIGAGSIFEILRRTNDSGRKIGVLTGTVVVLPASACPALQGLAEEQGMEKTSFSPHLSDANYVIVHQTNETKHKIVYMMTKLFQQGEIEILIGTTSLLGEGWDAPAVNSLILASFVGSFVLSNQIRGRAIRVQRGNSNKTSAIWHLACIDPTQSSGGEDMALMRRRFKSFVGISAGHFMSIENGIDRLQLPPLLNRQNLVEQHNAFTFACAAERSLLEERWQQAIRQGAMLIEEIKIPLKTEKGQEYRAAKRMYLEKTIAGAFATLLSAIAGFFGDNLLGLLRKMRYISSWREFWYILAGIGIMGGIYFGRSTYKTLRLYLKYRDIAKDIRRIGVALLHTMKETGTIQSNLSSLEVVSSQDEYGAVYCHLKGGTTFEQSSFINALQEITGPVNNPRYIIIRKSKFMQVLKQRDYHAVPESIGRNKKQAEYFEKQWKQHVGACTLVYTRNIEGRKLILKSRLHSLASQLDESPELINKWK